MSVPKGRHKGRTARLGHAMIGPTLDLSKFSGPDWAVFKNLRTSTKLYLLCGMFVGAIILATYSLVEEKQIAIGFVRKELVGARYLEALRSVYAVILAEVANSADGAQSARPPSMLRWTLWPTPKRRQPAHSTPSSLPMTSRARFVISPPQGRVTTNVS